MSYDEFNSRLFGHAKDDEDGEDNYEVCQKKWDDCKSKFPKITSKEQFDVAS